MNLSDIEMKVDNVSKKLEENTFAFEMLKELKVSSKRWFIVSVVLLIALVGTNIAWLIYEGTLETAITEEQLIEDIDNSNNSQYTQTIN